MLKIRVIPCLDVAEGRVVKGVNFAGLRDAGDPVEAAIRYDAAGADELCLLDIAATHENRGTLMDLVRRTAAHCFMPLTVGGGVRTPGDMGALLNAGADKVSFNSAAVADPGVVSAAADRFGSQAVVVAIDAKRVAPKGRTEGSSKGRTEGSPKGRTSSLPQGRTEGSPKGRTEGSPKGRTESSPGARSGGTPEGRVGGAPAGCDDGSPRDGWEIFTHGGRRATGVDALAFAREVAARGAGEILLTSMDGDGTRAGYDLSLIRAVSGAVRVPVIASGGVGTLDHLVEGARAGASAVLAASIFHFGEHTVAEAKAHMAAAGLPVRLEPGAPHPEAA